MIRLNGYSDGGTAGWTLMRGGRQGTCNRRELNKKDLDSENGGSNAKRKAKCLPLANGTINKLKGRATILFITYHVPRGLQVDEVYHLRGTEGAMRMELVEDGSLGGRNE
ncbi:MAG: hypothetical protein HZB40_04705 [Rhodocyclales bacterium]|nr:hypothetical protein [Rhodocyclales bacterium]